MKNRSKSLIVFGSILLMSCMAQAQESINTSGTDATGSGGSIAYSIGQVVYTTNSGTTGSVAQGVQQAYIISIVGIKEVTSGISLSAFPNPTSGNLTLQIHNYNNEKMQYQVYDMHGRLINMGQIISAQTLLDTDSLPVATYFIHVVNGENTKVESFKIIKNK